MKDKKLILLVFIGLLNTFIVNAAPYAAEQASFSYPAGWGTESFREADGYQTIFFYSPERAQKRLDFAHIFYTTMSVQWWDGKDVAIELFTDKFFQDFVHAREVELRERGDAYPLNASSRRIIVQGRAALEITVIAASYTKSLTSLRSQKFVLIPDFNRTHILGFDAYPLQYLEYEDEFDAFAQSAVITKPHNVVSSNLQTSTFPWVVLTIVILFGLYLFFLWRKQKHDAAIVSQKLTKKEMLAMISQTVGREVSAEEMVYYQKKAREAVKAQKQYERQHPILSHLIKARDIAIVLGILLFILLLRLARYFG